MYKRQLYDRAAKTIKDLLPKFDNWVDEFAWGSESKRILFAGGQKGEAPLFIVNSDGTNNEIPHLLVSDGEFGDLHPLPDGKTVVLSVMQTQRPSGIVKVEYAWNVDSERGYDCLLYTSIILTEVVP